MGGGAKLTPIASGVIGGPPDSLNNKIINNLLQSPSSSSSHLNLSANYSTGQPSYLAETSTNNLESVDLRRHRRAIGSDYDSVFFPVPSRIEVEKAISDLQRYMHGITSSKPEFSWLQQMLNHYEPTMMQTPGYKRVYDAYRLLQTDPSVQRMVASISSDKTVWDAVLKNQAVQDLSGSLYTAESERVESSIEEPDLVALILKWILGMAKNMISELMEKFGLLVNEIFQQKTASELPDDMEEKLRSSLLLSVVILVIVVVGRCGGV